MAWILFVLDFKNNAHISYRGAYRVKTNILCNHANYASGPWIPHPMATAPEVRFLQINARQPL